MKKQFRLIALAAALVVPAVNAKTLTIAPDMSTSNPLLLDPHFAASAAQYAFDQVLLLKEGDVVRIRSFGSRQDASNMLDQKLVISRRLRTNQAAALVKNYIASLPQKAAQAQSSTNIIAYLEFDSGLDCSNGGSALLLTDGVESSEYISTKAFLDGSKSLPAPDVSLSGCELTFFGMGAGLPAPQVRLIRKAWTKYITTAGGKFNAIIE